MARPDLATFFAVSLDLLCIRDADYRFVEVNPAWESALGYSAAELIGRPMLDFIHPGDRPASHGHMQRMAQEEEVWGFVNRYRRRDGEYRHLEWRARRVGDLVYGAARDVTDRVALEQARALAMAAAEASSQAKTDFLANMSHEIRTPLNGVIGVAAALARTDLAPQQREMLELIVRSGDTLERLVSDILDLSKIEAGRLEVEMREFDLRQELDGLVDMFRLRAEEKGLRYDAVFTASARGGLIGDGVRLRQIVANLLSNAIKFTAEGEVALRIDYAESTDGRSGRLEIEVRDTGVGFGDEFAQRLFQRFSQADGSITRRFGGSGLGLSICHALAERMGGAIGAVSRPGEGATFSVGLPLARSRPLSEFDAAAAAPTPDTVEDDLLCLEGCRVLLAEDHEINRRVVELILSPFGVRLDTAEDGAAAIRAFAGGTYDLILMDMQMPELDGLAATREIRRLETAATDPRRTPIIMLSANAMRHHADEALAAGADLHLAKPVTADSLIRGVLSALTARAQA